VRLGSPDQPEMRGSEKERRKDRSKSVGGTEVTMPLVREVRSGPIGQGDNAFPVQVHSPRD